MCVFQFLIVDCSRLECNSVLPILHESSLEHDAYPSGRTTKELSSIYLVYIGFHVSRKRLSCDLHTSISQRSAVSFARETLSTRNTTSIDTTMRVCERPKWAHCDKLTCASKKKTANASLFTWKAEPAALS